MAFLLFIYLTRKGKEKESEPNGIFFEVFGEGNLEIKGLNLA